MLSDSINKVTSDSLYLHSSLKSIACISYSYYRVVQKCLSVFFPAGYDIGLCWDLVISSVWVWSGLCGSLTCTQSPRTQGLGFRPQKCLCTPRCPQILRQTEEREQDGSKAEQTWRWRQGELLHILKRGNTEQWNHVRYNRMHCSANQTSTHIKVLSRNCNQDLPKFGHV